MDNNEIGLTTASPNAHKRNFKYLWQALWEVSLSYNSDLYGVKPEPDDI